MIVRKGEKLFRILEFVPHGYILTDASPTLDILWLSGSLLSGIRPGAARAARIATGEAFVKLCEMLNALALVNGEAAYKPLMDRIDELLAEARETVDRRLRHRKPGATNGQSVSPPDTPDSHI